MAAMRLVEELAGKRAVLEFRPRHLADVPATWADIGKAQQVLGWRPQGKFEDGVRNLVAWYQANRDWASQIQA